MAEDIKDHCVVTINVGEDQVIIHTYGPYSRTEANRLSKRYEFNSNFTVAKVRKLLDLNEVTAKPHSPRG